MNSSRRTFLKNTSLTLAGATLFSRSLMATGKKKFITGIQLYSIREDMKSNPVGTLKKLAGIGYRYVEHADYTDRKFYGYGAGEFKKILNDLGLQMKSGHTVLNATAWDDRTNDFTDTWKYTVEDAAVAGQQFVISPWLDEKFRDNMGDLKRFLYLFNKSGELCKKSGMKFGYHNHDFEFNTVVEGVRLYDIILKETDPELVIQQLDMGNMYAAGGRALELLNQYPGRFSSLHVKDEIKSEKGTGEEYESTILGTGVIPVKEVLDLSRKMVPAVHCIIEQESYQGKTALDCVEQDLQVMKKWGY